MKKMIAAAVKFRACFACLWRTGLIKRMTAFRWEVSVACLGVLLALATSPAHAGYYQHAVLTPSSVQGEMFTGVFKSNASAANATMAPIFYHNSSASDPWYEPSTAPLVVGYSVGGGNASALLGPVVNFGPQAIYGVEGLVGLFSDAAEASVVSFFKCSPATTACGSIAVGVLGNLNAEEKGKISTTWKEWGAHPVGYFLGPSVWFGGKPLASVN